MELLEVQIRLHFTVTLESLLGSVGSRCVGGEGQVCFTERTRTHTRSLRERVCVCLFVGLVLGLGVGGGGAAGGGETRDKQT